MVKLILNTTLAATLFSCGLIEQEEPIENLEPPPPIVTPADMTIGKMRPRDAIEIQSVMDGGIGCNLYANEPAACNDEDEADAGWDCIGSKMDALAVEAKDETLRVSGSIDVSECLTIDENIDTAASTIRVVLFLLCKEKDLNEYDGSTLGAITSLPTNPCQGAEEIEHTFQMVIDQETTGTDEWNNTEEWGVKLVIGQTNFNGHPCQYQLEGSNHYSNNCFQYNKFIINKFVINDIENTDANGMQSLDKIDWSGVREPDDGTSLFYASGAALLTLNDWTGSITYTSTTANPTWTVTRDSDTLEGTLGSEPGLRLTRPTNFFPDYSKRPRFFR